MSNDTTTISITTEQKAQLDEKKQHERESYKSVIGRMLEEDTETVGNLEPYDGEVPSEFFEATEADIDDAVKEILGRIDDLESQLPKKVVEELR